MGDGESAVLGRIKQEILEELREKLVKDLQPDKLFAFLRTKRVLDEDDCEEISSERTRRRRAEAFLDTISKKGHCGFDFFCESFLASGKTQLHLLNEILDMLEDRIHDSEVKPLPVYEVINIELFNQNLPRPGEPGAPCLPSCPNNLIPPGVFPLQSQLSLGTDCNSPPPAYSEY